MKIGSGVLVLSVAALCGSPASAFLPALPHQRSLVSRGRGLAAASDNPVADNDAPSAPPAATSAEAEEKLSRKEKNKEQVRKLLKGLGDLDDDDDDEAPSTRFSAKKRKREQSAEAKKALKDQAKLEPEMVFFEGGPHWSEAVVPTISILTVIGIFPFAASMARQIWVRYKITSRRISVVSGVGGKDLTEVIYPDIDSVRYVFRNLGATGDMVLFLRDNSKLELRSVPNFRDVYNFIRERLDSDAKERTPELPVASA